MVVVVLKSEVVSTADAIDIAVADGQIQKQISADIVYRLKIEGPCSLVSLIARRIVVYGWQRNSLPAVLDVHNFLLLLREPKQGTGGHQNCE